MPVWRQPVAGDTDNIRPLPAGSESSSLGEHSIENAAGPGPEFCARCGENYHICTDLLRLPCDCIFSGKCERVASRKQISFRDQLLKAPLSSAEKQCGLHRHICLIAFHSRQVLWDRSCTLSDERIRARSILCGWVGVCGFSYARRWSLVYFVVTGERLRSKVA